MPGWGAVLGGNHFSQLHELLRLLSLSPSPLSFPATAATSLTPVPPFFESLWKNSPLRFRGGTAQPPPEKKVLRGNPRGKGGGRNENVGSGGRKIFFFCHGWDPSPLPPPPPKRKSGEGERKCGGRKERLQAWNRFTRGGTRDRFLMQPERVEKKKRAQGGGRMIACETWAPPGNI